MGSTRLPGKVLADLCGRPLLERLIDRLLATRGIESLVVATTLESSDDLLCAWCASRSIPVYRGSSDDVLDRFWQCSQTYKPEVIVRVTADDPLKDPEIIQTALDICFSELDVDYVSNTLTPSYPEGLDIEVLRYRALERANKEATLQSEREHVTPYIWKNPHRFKLRNFCMDVDMSELRLTVDKPADLELMRKIFANFSDNPLIDYRSVIAWILDNPDLLLINSGTARNEGYYQTLAKESTR